MVREAGAVPQDPPAYISPTISPLDHRAFEHHYSNGAMVPEAGQRLNLRQLCEGFQMPAAEEQAARSGGRRLKTSKGGNRGACRCRCLRTNDQDRFRHR
jgi:hypothetical protein